MTPAEALAAAIGAAQKKNEQEIAEWVKLATDTVNIALYYDPNKPFVDWRARKISGGTGPLYIWPNDQLIKAIVDALTKLGWTVVVTKHRGGFLWLREVTWLRLSGWHPDRSWYLEWKENKPQLIDGKPPLITHHARVVKSVPYREPSNVCESVCTGCGKQCGRPK